MLGQSRLERAPGAALHLPADVDRALRECHIADSERGRVAEPEPREGASAEEGLPPRVSVVDPARLVDV